MYIDSVVFYFCSKVDVVKNRWKSVRDNYRKNINKKLKNPKNHKPYRYAEEINFLDKYFMFPER